MVFLDRYNYLQRLCNVHTSLTNCLDESSLMSECDDGNNNVFFFLSNWLAIRLAPFTTTGLFAFEHCKWQRRWPKTLNYSWKIEIFRKSFVPRKRSIQSMFVHFWRLLSIFASLFLYSLHLITPCEGAWEIAICHYGRLTRHNFTA